MTKHFLAPLLITGLPRSRTSMVAGILGKLGLWLGTTVPGGASNPKGFFEHYALREQVNKRILARLNCDPLGVKKMPLLMGLPRMEGLQDRVEKIVIADSYNGGSPWGFKDAKLTLLWPIWNNAFPKARWLIVNRPRELVIKSCLKTDFMRQHSGETEFWERFCDAYASRLKQLRTGVPSVMEIDASTLIDGDLEALTAR